MIDPSDALLAPYESGYPKNNTLQLTQNCKNQKLQILHKSVQEYPRYFFPL